MLAGYGVWSSLGRAGMTVQEHLGHYTIPLKRDMKPTGVGRNLQICGDPELCSRAVNMIYSKPFPDGTIKTRGSGFGNVSWSRLGCRGGLGTWQRLQGHPAGDRQVLSPTGSYTCPGGCSGPLRAPRDAQHPCGVSCAE